MKPEVQIADQPRYDPQEIRARVKRMMEKDSLSIKGKSVFVKPSFVYPARPPLNRAVNTQPEFVGGVAHALRDLGAARVWVGEDSLLGPSQSGFLAMGVLPYIRDAAEPVYLQDENEVLIIHRRGLNFPYFMAAFALLFYMPGAYIGTAMVARELGWPGDMIFYGVAGGIISCLLATPMAIYAYHWLAGPVVQPASEKAPGLAQQSAHASSDIRALMETIQKSTQQTSDAAEGGRQRVDAGGEAIREVGEALERISSFAGSTTYAVSEITLSTAQQTTASEQLASSIMEVHNVAKRVEDGAGQIENAVTEIQSFSEALRETVEKKD